MIFIVLTFIAAFLIEGLGTLVSVIGLSTLFGANPIIIGLAVALDIGKLTVVSLLYTYWGRLNKVMRVYAFFAAVVTMIITSAGAAGYLSGEFQKAIIGTQEGSTKVQILKDQQGKYQERKKQIDDQIAALPEKTTVNQRLRLINGFKQEQTALDGKINDIDKQLPDLQIKQIGTEAKAGPILYIAKAFNIPVEEAVKYVILMIIFVFDPLAVFLIISGNFLLSEHRRNKPAESDHLRVSIPDDLPSDPPAEYIHQGGVLMDDHEMDNHREGYTATTPDEMNDVIDRIVTESTIEPLKVEDIPALNEQFALPEEVKAEVEAAPDFTETSIVDEPIGEQTTPETVADAFEAPVEPIHPITEEALSFPDEPDVDVNEQTTPGAPVFPAEPEVSPEPLLPEVDSLATKREEITLDQLKPNAVPHNVPPVAVPHASLSDVAAADDITFEDHPARTSLGSYFSNLR